jgi:hypothetical protein
MYIFVYLYIYIHLYVYIYISLHLAIYLSIHLSIYPSIHLSIYPSIYSSIHLLIYNHIDFPWLLSEEKHEGKQTQWNLARILFSWKRILHNAGATCHLKDMYHGAFHSCSSVKIWLNQWYLLSSPWPSSTFESSKHCEACELRLARTVVKSESRWICAAFSGSAQRTS